MGAAWIHGCRSNPLTKLAKDFKLPFADSGSKMERFFADGTPMKSIYELVETVGEIHENIESTTQFLYHKLKSSNMQQSNQTSMQQLSNEAIEILKIPAEKLDPKQYSMQLLQYYQSGTEQYEGADYKDLSCHNIDLHSDYSGGDAAILGGYGVLIEKLSEGLNIKKNRLVTSIDYSKNRILIECANGEKYECEKCIITTSLGVLQKNPPLFSPSLPPWKLEAINSIGFGLMNKVVMHFPSVFWNVSLHSIGYCAVEKGHFRWFFNGYYVSKNKPVLIAFLSVCINASISLNFSKCRLPMPGNWKNCQMKKLLNKLCKY
jgi:lysine-specific histone demethylase 1